MIGTIFRKEVSEFRRDRRVVLLAIVVAILALSATIAGAFAESRQASDRAVAVAGDRAIWNAQGEVNPHSASHFGMFAFKPRPALALFDPGLSAWQGEAVWVEAHYQNPAQARPAERETLVQRFGDLSPAWLLQVLLPLVIIVTGFATVAGERERGSLRLQLVQGASARRLAIGKGAALLASAAAVCVPLLALGGIAALIVATDRSDAALRWLLLSGTYLLYAGIWVAITLAVSLVARTARQALLALLVFWAVSTVLAPRLAADLAANRYPAVSAGAFWDEVREAREQGIDGHAPGDARAKILEAAVLRQHGVDDIDDLPFDFAGVALQAGEDYGNLVFDRLYGRLAGQERAQSAMQLAFAAVSPTLALKPLSSGLAGTDVAHQEAFTAAAERHRRAVQRRLNQEQTETGKGQNFKNKVDADFWSRIRTFDYRIPAISGMAASLGAPLLVLLLWLGASSLAALAAMGRLETSA